MNTGSGRPQFGRHTDRAPGENGRRGNRRQAESEFRTYRGESYYGLPVVKPSPWGWLIASYFFAGGLAGAAQIIAAMADLFGGSAQRPVVRAGRLLALAGTLISPPLLILDLHTPTRWYNMLRIARRSSPMSIGSWILSAFGLASTVAAASEIFPQKTSWPVLTYAGRIAGIGGAVAGAAMATYTATLLSATSTPLWLTGWRQLPVLFGSTAMASAVAGINLFIGSSASGSAHRRPLASLGLLSSVAQLWSLRELERAWSETGIQSPTADRPMDVVDAVLIKGAGIAVPMVTHACILASGRSLQPLGALAALATLAGAFAERWLVVRAGNESTTRPTDYFRISQPSPGEISSP